MPDLLRYFPYSLTLIVENLTDSEFDPELWHLDPDMDMEARALRDQALMLDLIGCIDSPNPSISPRPQAGEGQGVRDDPLIPAADLARLLDAVEDILLCATFFPDDEYFTEEMLVPTDAISRLRAANDRVIDALEPLPCA